MAGAGNGDDGHAVASLPKGRFDHLFRELHCGPQVAALQSDKWLCWAQVRLPPDEQRVQGGQVDYTGDYSESGIELANEDRDIWTAGAFRFWQKHCENRQTVVYAVSVRHAQNLVGVFNDAAIPAGLLLGDTTTAERARLIDQFRDGTIRVLINIAVATEGFDLPDAACVVLTRPTMSLSLYLQMVGRGLRPKQDDGDCVILDLAGNSLRHGLPEEERAWSLQPRGEQVLGEFPLMWCPDCGGLSPAGSHECSNCVALFGEPCGRCGDWRAWKRWSRKTVCGQDHDLVCDLCHYDAHIQARLPVAEELKELSMPRDDDELSPNRDPFLKNFLEEERRRIGGSAEDRKEELRFFIGVRESELADVNGMWSRFEQDLQSLPDEQRPENEPLKAIAFVDWKNNQESELNGWKEELASLERQLIDGQLVFNNARNRLMRLFEAEARELDCGSSPTLRETPLRTTLEEPSPSRLAKGPLTPQREFIRPILESLVELGGSAKRSLVLDSVFQKMKGKLSERDLEPPPSKRSDPRWLKKANWCRLDLVRKHEFLKPDSPRGVWEITDLGRNYLKVAGFP